MINKTKPECETKLCNYDSATRTRFYNGMLLTAEHLRDEQAYHREALKRVNRNLFGSGIVCGLEVEIQPRGLCVKIQPGVALDCCGNLIEVCNCITVDLSKECKDRYGADCISPPDPKNPDQYTITKYLVLRYAEKPSDPQQVFTPGDECQTPGEKPNCEASKIREGYCIELWDECPCPEEITEPDTSLVATLKERSWRNRQQAALNQRQAAMNPQQSGQQVPASHLSEGRKDCIDLPLPCADCGCCESTNAVGLAELKINCAESIVKIENCTCRRYIISPRLLTWLFSRLQSKKYLSNEMTEVYPQLGYLPVAHLMATAVGYETNIEQLQDHETRIYALEQPQRPSKRPSKLPLKKPPATPNP